MRDSVARRLTGRTQAKQGLSMQSQAAMQWLKQ